VALTVLVLAAAVRSVCLLFLLLLRRGRRLLRAYERAAEEQPAGGQ